jgi:hypothetical protein
MEISKCRYSKLDWSSQTNGSYILTQTHTRPEPISIIDHESKLPQDITSLPTSDPYKLLGVHMALVGIPEVSSTHFKPNATNSQ